MMLATGSRLGPYEILAPLGAGGMGEVYRARDTRLERIVAIKILPAHLSEKPAARERFEREAKAISSLNHPNICHLYDVGSQDGVSYLVMEYLEGETLAERLRKGPLTLDQILKYGVDICDGLETAHRTGVVHRDLKPANIMLTKSGARLMDFGLAKPSVATLGSGSSSLKTRSEPLTAEGSMVGTFQYMSPEQVEGKEVDGRSDVFSLGAVLYEMVTGKRAFEGKSQLSVASAILEKEPEPISVVKPMTPPEMERVVRVCLAKDPDARVQSAHDVRLQLEWIATGALRPRARAASSTRERWILITMLILLIVALAAVLLRPSRDAASATWSSILAPEGTSLAYFAGPVAVSHDGRKLAVVATTSDGKDVVWVRSLGAPDAQALPGTVGASYPFWSGDDRQIGFFAGGKLKTTEAVGGPVVIVCEAAGARGGAWNESGVILFSSTWGGVKRVSISGGTPAEITKLDPARGELSHRWPSFLPDGRHFFYLASNFRGGSAEAASIYLGSLDSTETKILFNARSNAAYIPGHLLFVRNRLLMAQPFDEQRLEIRGEPIPIVEQVQYDELTWRGVFSGSETGVLAYQGGNTGVNSRLVMFDRSGKQLRIIGTPGDLIIHRISPDGQRVAVSVMDPSVMNYQLRLHDLFGEKETRLTLGPHRSRNPVWSPDGKTIVFSMNKKGPYDLFEKRSDGTGSEELVWESGANKFATDWSADGRFVVYSSSSGTEKSAVWILPRFGERKPYVFVQGDHFVGEARFSPDGRWLAYTSDESGRAEIYVTPFPQAASKWQVSAEGGTSAKWRRDGKELYYLSADSRLVAVDVGTGGDIFQVGAARPLFQVLLRTGPSRFDLSSTSEQIGYDSAPDGTWFVVNSPPEGSPPPITLITNWSADLKRR
ncbi:MAG TPA: protein kinase [Candidatus Polarisedimenticolia bacterium]|nr:protein kinase [Candidatus Polarisedimenticolia bacterium]